jgi:hypothetical protein
MSKSAVIVSGILGGLVLAAPLAAPAQPATESGAASAEIMGTWVRSDAEARFQPPASGAGPVRDDPAHPHHGHREGVLVCPIRKPRPGWPI